MSPKIKQNNFVGIYSKIKTPMLSTNTVCLSEYKAMTTIVTNTRIIAIEKLRHR